MCRRGGNICIPREKGGGHPRERDFIGVDVAAVAGATFSFKRTNHIAMKRKDDQKNVFVFYVGVCVCV